MEEYNTIFNLLILVAVSGFTGFTIAKSIYKKNKSIYVSKKDEVKDLIKKQYTL